MTEEDGRLLSAIAARVTINEAEIGKLRDMRHSFDSIKMVVEMLKERQDAVKTEQKALVDDVETLMIAAREGKGARSVIVVIAEKLWPIVPALVVYLWGMGRHP